MAAKVDSRVTGCLNGGCRETSRLVIVYSMCPDPLGQGLYRGRSTS